MSEPDLWRQQLERYEAVTAAIMQNLAGIAAMEPPRHGVLRSAQARLADERDRQEWIREVKRRLGLVCTGDTPDVRPAPSVP